MKKIIISCVILAMGISSCVEDEASNSALDVTLDKVEYQVGEPVTFKFDGDPDNIVFYSGESGHNYEFRDRTNGDADLLVSFKTFVRYGDIYNNLQFMVSNDFNGIYDKDNVEAATWVDLSDQLRFSVGADQTPSGEISLKEYIKNEPESNLYFAFRYKDVEKARQNNWIVRSMQLDQVSPEGIKVNMASMPAMEWKAVDFLNSAVTWSFTSEQIVIDGGSNQPENDDWAISKAFNAKKIASDTGVALKNISTTMSEYQHVFTKPGTYHVVFETTSDWYNGGNHSLQQVEVRIVGEPKVELPATLNVVSDKMEYQKGDTVTFSLSGNNADNIVFYSGEHGHNFDFKDRFYADNDLTVDFSTFVRYGDIYQNLQFLISTDFNGVYDTESVAAATWIDLTDQFAFSTGTDKTLSGEVSLKNYVGDNPNAQVYVAFQYKDIEKPRQNNWIVRAINLNQISPEGFVSNLANMKTMGWKAVDFLNEAKSWTITSSQLVMDGGANQPENDDWVVSKAFDIRKGAPDTGTMLGSINNINDYQYVYNTPGTYKVVFDWYNGSKYSQVEMTIEVKE